MSNPDFVVVGGGLGGAAFALTQARRGRRVCVLERETRFRDRVRGEGMNPWGAAEARALGIDEILLGADGRELPLWTLRTGPMVRERDLRATTRHGIGVFSFSHPAMQEALLAAAASAGADVRRGVVVRGITPGEAPRVSFEEGGETRELAARLVVASDGRTSAARRFCGFEARQAEPRLKIAGVLLEAPGVPVGTVSMALGQSRLAILFPLRDGRVRAYLAWHIGALEATFAGETAFPRLVEESLAAGAVPAWYEGARVIGPLATFDGADTWVDAPYAGGVALIGDAASTSDPSWGQGLSLTLRDVRVLAEELAEDDDTERAGRAYAAAHDRYSTTLRTAEDWYTDLMLSPGPEADQRRMRAFMAASVDPSRMIDAFQSGPDMELDEAARRRFFGE